MEKQNGSVSSLLCLYEGMNMETERLMVKKREELEQNLLYNPP